VLYIEKRVYKPPGMSGKTVSCPNAPPTWLIWVTLIGWAENASWNWLNKVLMVTPFKFKNRSIKEKYRSIFKMEIKE
jgi:hypothetical protein